MKVSIVSPLHIQPSKEWITALDNEAKISGADVIIVHDSWKIQKMKGLPKSWKVFTYTEQLKYFGKDLYSMFKQFHKSSSIKNFGMIYSYREKYDVCIVIDSDCIVQPDFVALHLAALEIPGDGWQNPIPETGLYSRGFPYSKRKQEKWCHMGLWTNELDLYGKDRIDNDNIPKELKISHAYNHVPGFIPLSGMNVSFKREALPYMLFLPNFTTDTGEKFIRHDDIWGGYIFQKIAKSMNKSISYGLPIVYHDTVVDPVADAIEEEPMYKYEDEFIDMVDEAIHNPADLDAQQELELVKIYCRANSTFENLESAFDFQLKAYANI